MEKKNWEENEIIRELKKSAEQEQIPENLEPEHMKEKLEKTVLHKKSGNKKWYGMLATAACLGIILFAADRMNLNQNMQGESKNQEHVYSESARNEEAGNQSDRGKTEKKSADGAGNGDTSRETEPEEGTGTTYEELYRFFQKRRREQRMYDRKYGAIKSDAQMESQESTGAVQDSSQAENGTGESSHGETNRQEKGIDEADIIKNDGRYLYQSVLQRDGSMAVQIADTRDGLKELIRVEGFENINELYVWKDTLVVLDEKWAEPSEQETKEIEDPVRQTTEKAAEDVGYIDSAGTAYTEISIYSIKDRKTPKKQHVFTVKGYYLDSRISKGYLYFFSRSSVEELGKMKDYNSYIPILEGRKLDASSIYLPGDTKALSYLVLASVNLETPDQFKDVKAAVTSADRVYVTGKNIYVTDSGWSDVEEDGRYSDSTGIMRFSYQDGRMKREAEGAVKGHIQDDMSLSEWKGHLRLVTSVHSYRRHNVLDDLFGEIIGYDTTDVKDTNSLYVLDEDLEISGKIENLAEGERIYSARFMEDAGYFVTFRNTDPLFSVDLSNPSNPRILGELKVSGFSEYLHFYDENLLLGIGKEAEIDTGRAAGMKLSMFDITNPADVKEKSRYLLTEYDEAEALYEYKAVLIDTEKNLFGFWAQNYDADGREDYLLFTYEDGTFRELFRISCKGKEYGRTHRLVRGTYIGEVFYLMYGDGTIEAYCLSDGSLTEKIDPLS